MHARFVSVASMATILVCAAGVSSTALAQDLENSDDGYLAAKLMLGFGGEAKGETEEIAGFDISGDSDMEASYGLGVAYMHPLHDYFALGGQLALLSWTTETFDDADADRSTMIDISLVPQLKYAVTNSVELYASVPLGLTLNALGEDQFGTVEVGGGLGFNLALMLGARFALSDGIGLLAELGYSYHAFTHELTEEITDTTYDFDISTGQFALNVGVWFEL